MTVNVAFLRSGAQFVVGPNKLAAAPLAVSSTSSEAKAKVLVTAAAASEAPPSKHQRMERFYQRMLAARQGKAKAAPRRAPEPVTEASPVPVLNVTFLKSGIQFEPAHDAGGAAVVDRPTKYSRLERFYAKSLAARQAKQTERAEPTPAAVAPPLANTLVTPKYQFMWAGDALETTTAPGTPETARLSKAQRLARFHTRTQDAAAAAAATRLTTLASSTEQRPRAMAAAPSAPESRAPTTAAPSLSRPAATMVNLAFLRSGAEFYAGQGDTTAALGLGSPRSARLTRHEKLERFYAQTLDARKPAAAPSGGTTATAASPPPSPSPSLSNAASSGPTLTRSQRRSLRATVGM